MVHKREVYSSHGKKETASSQGRRLLPTSGPTLAKKGDIELSEDQLAGVAGGVVSDLKNKVLIHFTTTTAAKVAE